MRRDDESIFRSSSREQENGAKTQYGFDPLITSDQDRHKTRGGRVGGAAAERTGEKARAEKGERETFAVMVKRAGTGGEEKESGDVPVNRDQI